MDISEKTKCNSMCYSRMLIPAALLFTRHEQERHALTVDDGGDDNRDKYGYYKCRGPCSLVFTTNATRKRLILIKNCSSKF